MNSVQCAFDAVIALTVVLEFSVLENDENAIRDEILLMKRREFTLN